MTQINYHAVMEDETGCEFGVDLVASSRDDAYDQLSEDYPESRCVQLESDRDREDREDSLYTRAQAEYDDPW